MYTHIHIPSYTVYLPTYLPTYLPACLPACLHTYIHACIHTYIHTHTDVMWPGIWRSPPAPHPVAWSVPGVVLHPALAVMSQKSQHPGIPVTVVVFSTVALQECTKGFTDSHNSHSDGAGLGEAVLVTVAVSGMGCLKSGSSHCSEIRETVDVLGPGQCVCTKTPKTETMEMMMMIIIIMATSF